MPLSSSAREKFYSLPALAHSVRVLCQTDTMLSRLLVIVIVLSCGVAVATRNRLEPDSFKVPVGLLYHRGQRHLYNILKGSLYDHTPANSNYTFRIVKERFTHAFNLMDKVCSLYSRGVKTIVAMTPPEQETTAYSQLSAASSMYHIPLISYSIPEMEGKPSPFILTIKPSTVRASLDLMQYYGWKNIAYIKDSRIESARFQKELESSATPYIFNISTIVDISDGCDLIHTILAIDENMTSEEQIHAVLHISAEHFKEIIFVFATLNVNRPVHLLVVEPLIGDNFADISDSSYLKLTTFNLFESNDKESELLMSDHCSTCSAEDILLSSEAGAVLGAAFHRLYKLKSDVFDYEDYNTEKDLNQCNGSPAVPLIHGLTVSLEIKNSVSIDGYSGNLEFDIHGRRRNYVLRIREATADGSYEIGTWSDRGGLKMNLQVQLPVHYIAPKPAEKRYIITSILEQPYLALHGKTYFGFCKELLDLLSNRLKFKYDLKLVDDKHYGTYNDVTHKWNGMIGEVVYGKADMAVAPLTVTSRRSLAVDFTVPFQEQGITLLLKKPTKKASLCNFVFSPFTWQLWTFIVFVYVALGVLYILICQCVESPKIQSEHDVPWYTRLWPHRALLLVCLMFTVMIASMYIANLGAILSYQHTSWSSAKRLDFKDVFTQSVITRTPKMLLLRQGSTKTFFQKSKIPLYRRYWNQVMTDPSHFVSSYQEGVQRVLQSNGDAALFINSASGEYFANENCDVQLTSSSLNVRSYAIALPLNHSLRSSLNEAILSFREFGVIDSLYAKWWQSKCTTNHNSENSGSRGKPIELLEVGGLFYVLTFGFGLIVLTIGLQIFYMKRRTSTQSDSRVSLCHRQSL